jgi:hypothetical protein
MTASTNREVSARYTAPDERTMSQVINRQLHDSLAVTAHVGADYELGTPYFEQAGFARIPRLSMTVTCKERDYSAIQGMILHRAAVSHIGALGWSSDHLAFYPSMGRGKTRMFTAADGSRRRGVEHRVSFELSPALAAAIDWNGYSYVRGQLKVRENGLPV